MKSIINITVILFNIIIISNIYGQSAYVSGNVKGKTTEGKTEILAGANVYWADVLRGTTSDERGNFKLMRVNESNKLVISYMGYKTDTIIVNTGKNYIEVILENAIELDEIQIKENRGTSYFLKSSVQNTQILTSSELKKAACCNLSESFETNASVDVSFADALTGAKQIELLGLTGIYTQMQMENIPSLRGLASIFGLTYVPGPWLESIQISKGTASVKNGFESVAGQINYEYRKPDTSEKFYLNFFGNSLGRAEFNAYSSYKFNKKLSTMIFLHGNYFKTPLDKNKDGFYDLPLSSQYIIFNRWKIILNRYEGQAGILFTEEFKNGGQLKFNEKTDKGTQNAYGLGINTRRIEGFYKGGFISSRKESTSTALLASASHHNQQSYFGLNNFSAEQTSFYSNLIHQTYLFDTRNGFVAGISFIYDNYKMFLNDSNMSRKDIVPGIFAEYTYNSLSKLIVIAGMRSDYHTDYGILFTPRFHLRYKINDIFTLRTSAGKGYRFPNVIAENTMLLVTSKTIIFEDKPALEEAWNYGLFLSAEKKFLEKPFRINLDFYRTDFINQVIIDMDLCSDLVHIYNLAGKSYSNSGQIELSFEPLERLQVLLAYRINDVKTTYFGILKEKLMSKKSKGILNLAYSTPWDKWKFDFTIQYNGKSRLPQLIQNDIPVQEYSPDFYIINAQISKNFKNFELYLGGENLTDFVQENLILGYENPFSNEFDASRIWGPVTGRRIYAGLRLTLK